VAAAALMGTGATAQTTIAKKTPTKKVQTWNVGHCDEKVKYPTLQNCPPTKNLTAAFDPQTKTLTISGTGQMWGYRDYDGASEVVPWTSYRSQITTIVINAGVTDVGHIAFYLYPKLTAINVDAGNANYSSVDGVLYNKDKTTLIIYPKAKKGRVFSIPQGVKIIEHDALSGCAELAEINIPNSVTRIALATAHMANGLDGTAWYNAQSDGVLYLGNVLIGYKGNMPENTHIKVREGTTVMADCHFGRNMISIALPDGLTNIGANAFKECEGLTSINISNSVTRIGEWAFSQCKALTSVTIPESVKRIEEYAFNSTGLTSVTIPSGITTIENKSFYNCRNLASVTIPEGVTTINIAAFSQCDALFSINIPHSVRSIGGYAFEKCWGLTSLTIPEGVTSIGESAFENTGLTEVFIPQSVQTIGARAFYDCSKLLNVYNYSPTPQVIEPYTIWGGSSEIDLYVPAESVDAYKNAEVWKNFKQILPIPQNVK
jgi:hypothetical protein